MISKHWNGFKKLAWKCSWVHIVHVVDIKQGLFKLFPVFKVEMNRNFHIFSQSFLI